jgi:pimeloyl-ACP methyl ester carboxylesterase
MTLALMIIVALLGPSVLITLIGSWLIARAHPPRGRRIDVDGLLQHVVDVGPMTGGKDDPPLVLLHGAGCNLEDMRLALGERLAARHRVILVDRPGAGWSERLGRTSSSPAVQAAMLRDLLDRLGVARAVLVGHSWGGALALAFAHDHPQRTAGLVLLSPPTHPHLQRMTRLYRPLAAPTFGRLFAHTLALPLAAAAFDAGLRAAFAPQLVPRRYLEHSAAFLLLRPAAFLANARDMADLQAFLTCQAPRYRELAVPTVIVQGDSDGIVPIEKHAKALAAAALHAKLVVLPGIGHMPHHAAMDRVVAEIEQLVATSK